MCTKESVHILIPTRRTGSTPPPPPPAATAGHMPTATVKRSTRGHFSFQHLNSRHLFLPLSLAPLPGAPLHKARLSAPRFSDDTWMSSQGGDSAGRSSQRCDNTRRFPQGHDKAGRAFCGGSDPRRLSRATMLGGGSKATTIPGEHPEARMMPR